MAQREYTGNSRAVIAVKLSAGLYLVVSTAILVFGRNVPAIWQGMVGILASLEGYYGAESLDDRRVFFFVVTLVPLVAVSSALGVLAVTGSEILVNCGSQGVVVTIQGANDNTTTYIRAFESCSTSFQLYGFVELLGGAAVGALLILIVSYYYRPLQKEARAFEARQDEMESSSLVTNIPTSKII